LGVRDIGEMRIAAPKEFFLSIRLAVDALGPEPLEVRVMPGKCRAGQHRLTHTAETNHDRLHNLIRLGPDPHMIERIIA
jgi:hypothetical protein